MPHKIEGGFGLPAGSDGWSDWTWFHARASQETMLTILCEEPVNYLGHFRKGRMVPCLGDACPLCATGLGNQARYVFSVVEWETKRVGLLELGRGHALQLQDWMATNGGLRGLSITIQRSSVKKQSAIDLKLLEIEAPIYFHHLKGPDLKRALESTFSRSRRVTLEGESSGDEEGRRSA